MGTDFHQKRSFLTNNCVPYHKNKSILFDGLTVQKILNCQQKILNFRRGEQYED